MDFTPAIFTALALLVGLSVLATRMFVVRRNRGIFKARVSEFIPLKTQQVAVKTTTSEDGEATLPKGVDQWLRSQIELAGWNTQPQDVLLGCICLMLVSGTVLYTFTGLGPFFSALIAILLFSIPLMALRLQARRTINKLELQLPNALDLMVSVLRSGHSIPQSIKAIANEMPNPCGREFGEVLHRINLGQTLPDAMSYSVARYKSFELDLLRRALYIHVEVGGSLAELLEKTNATLRGRIKLKRHVDILTAPSKLTCTIVAVLPFVVAGTTFFLAPSYLEPLFQTKIGNALVALGIALQITGVLIMRRMAAFKV